MSDTVMNRHDRTVVGFWLYLMTDCLLFGSLFATYIVLLPATAGGPGPADIFTMPLVLTGTIILLTSSLTSGLALIAARRGNVKQTISWLVVTGLLGAAFLSIELYEFSKLIHEGFGWQASAFLSIFFTLVATHGAHIFIGLLWLTTMVVSLVKAKRVTSTIARRLTLFGTYWHFLDLIWIFIFTVVYLMGIAS